MKLTLYTLVMSMFLMSASPFANPSADQRCRRVELEFKNPWIPYMSWSLDGEHLFLPAVFDGSIYVFGPEDNLTHTLLNPGRGRLEWTKPYKVDPVEGAGFLLLTPTSFIWLNDKFEPFDGRFLRQTPKVVDSLDDMSPYHPSVSATGVMTFYGDIKVDGEWETGFYSLPLNQDRREVALIRSDSTNSHHREFGTSSLDLITTVGDQAYLVIFEKDEPRLYSAKAPKDPLKAFPSDFKEAPNLKPGPGYLSPGEKFALLENSKMVAGIYGWDDDLYFLTRDPLGDGGTRWRLHRVDLLKDQIIAQTVLPTKAPWIVLAPGPMDWAILEKGRFFDAPPRQEIHSLLLVPTPWIESKNSPLQGENPEVESTPSTAASSPSSPASGS